MKLFVNDLPQACYTLYLLIWHSCHNDTIGFLFSIFMIFNSRLIQSIMCFLHLEYSMCFRIGQQRARVYPNGRERPFFGRLCPQSHSSKISLSGNCFTGQYMQLKVLILAIVFISSCCYYYLQNNEVVTLPLQNKRYC